MLKAVHEINEVLTKNKEGFSVDFVGEAYNVFDNQTLLYLEEKRILQYEDETFYKNAINKDSHYLDSLIKNTQKIKNLLHILKN